MHPENLSIKDFTYFLPEEKIAFHPLEKRDAARLLVYKNGVISETIYQHIAAFIPQNTLMVFNNTRVVEARLLFQKDTGGVIEIFCLEPHEQYADITTAMNKTGSVQWLCLIGGASKWKNGLVLRQSFIVDGNSHTLEAAYIEKRSDCFVTELKWAGDFSFAEVLHYAGHVPLPPYIKRNDTESDKNRYQTVFAKYDGSVAAPTAGLHFTDEVLASLSQKGVAKDFVTLHVGAGTFKPVKAGTMQEHEMHAEFIEVNQSLIENIIKQPARGAIAAVGTTSLRTLESLYWLGCKLLNHKDAFKQDIPFLSQWEAYRMTQHPREAALQALLAFLKEQRTQKLVAKTQIIIAPGYEFKIADGLVTNFHQPASTLLLLVAAFIGNDWKKVYNYALENNFRFLSYGDGSLLWRKAGS